MPGIVQVKVVSARDLPIMDRSSELTDAFVELKLGQTFHKTDVCPKTLNPVWDSPWFKFNVEEEDLQAEPLQIKLMDYDLYTAHDAIGKVYISLNSLANSGPQTSSTLDGWFPIFDTLHGIQGEVHVIVNVEMIKDQHRFKQSSCEIMFFSCSVVPAGYTVQAIHGFVEELVVNDDPEYQWMDKIRTPRASNEARQRLFLKLSGDLQRKIGLKTIEVGGNSVVGYRQCFDLEGETGIVVRGIGTCVSLTPSSFTQGPSPSILLPANIQPQLSSSVGHAMVTPEDIIMDPLGSVVSPARRHISRKLSSSDSDEVPSSPTKTAGTSGGSGGLHPTSGGPTPTLNHVMSSSEFPFLTLSVLPDDMLYHFGGIVSARSVKLLDKINNPDEPETRDAWWYEVRNEVRSHARALSCNAVIGYSESTSICDTLCVFSAIGTAVCVGPSSYQLAKSSKQPTSPSSINVSDSQEEAGTAGTTQETKVESVLCDHCPHCGVCHIPYSVSKPPFDSRLFTCAICQSKCVPSIVLSTGEVPLGVAVRGRGTLIQARVLHHKRKMKGVDNAVYVSKQLPFLEYKLHGRLLNKLRVKGMNAIFHLKMQVTVGDTMIIGIATGTAVYLEALPPPSRLLVDRKETPSDHQHLSDIKAALDRAQDENRKKYDLEHSLDIPSGSTGEMVRTIEEEGDELDLSYGNKEALVFEVEDQVLKEEDLLEVVLDKPLPEGFHVSNTHIIPGIGVGSIAGEAKMVTMVAKKVWGTVRQHLEKEFTQFFDKILQTLVFKVRGMHSCQLTNIRYDVDLPDDDEIQVAVTAMVTKLVTDAFDATAALKANHSDELIFAMEDTNAGHTTQRPLVTMEAGARPDTEIQKVVHITPLPFLPGWNVDQYLGIINLFLIRESTSIRENDGLASFMHLFILEAVAIARAHVAALGGNAILNYQLNECVLIDHPHKNQAQCLLNLSGDAVQLKCPPSLTRTVEPSPNDSPQHHVLHSMQLISMPDLPAQAQTSSNQKSSNSRLTRFLTKKSNTQDTSTVASDKQTKSCRVTEL